MRSYDLDLTDRLTAIGGEWQEFWDRNGGQGNVSEKVIGSLLWNAVSGPATTSYLSQIFYRVRREQIVISQQYRFDSAQNERVFAMKVEPLPKGGVRVGHNLVRDRPHAPGLVRDMPHLTYRKCSQCLSCNFGGPWVSHVRVRLAERAVAADAVCPACVKGIVSTEQVPWDDCPPLYG